MFTKIIYINLDRRTDRNENVINELDKVGINNNNYTIERIPGVDASLLDFNNISTDLFTTESINTALDKNNGVGGPMTKGAVGCALAHRNCYLNILESNHDYVLILEDDIFIDDNFLDKLNSYEIPEFDILFLGWHSHYHMMVEATNITEYCFTPKFLFGLFGYIINKKAAHHLLNLFPLTFQIDTEMRKVFPELRVYALNEKYNLIHSEHSSTTSKFGTDIQIREDFISNHYTDYTDYLIIFLIILFILLVLYRNK